MKALVRKLSGIDLHLAAWRNVVGHPGQIWLEEDGFGFWLVRILRSPVWEEGKAQGTLIRIATEADLAQFQDRRAEADALAWAAQKEAKEFALPMKFIAGELDLERRFLRLFFTAPGRVDFRELVKSLERKMKLRIELRQMGARDAARLIGGIGPCGRPLCCQTFLRKLSPIRLELAFDQQLFLSPGRITGLCGRLMCCLAYEHEQYRKAIHGLPKVGDGVEIGVRKGKVVGINMFHNTITIQWSDGTRQVVPWHLWPVEPSNSH